MKQYHLFIRPKPIIENNNIIGISGIYYRMTELGEPCSENEIDAKCKAISYNNKHNIPLHVIINENIAKKWSLSCSRIYSKPQKWPLELTKDNFEYDSEGGWATTRKNDIELILRENE